MTTRPLRSAALLGALGLTLASLTGCASLSYEEAQASDHRVIETDSDFWSGESWSYVRPSGEEIPLTVDCGDFWSGKCAASEDGVFEFHWSKDKHGTITKATIVIDGIEWPADCASEGAFLSGPEVCAPLPRD